jgi:hypothetical protein
MERYPRSGREICHQPQKLAVQNLVAEQNRAFVHTANKRPDREWEDPSTIRHYELLKVLYIPT